ncbi:hypothetical protein QFZ55_000037 [Streptomyces luteogriseus]|uniref:hypothetical protein n=1 Tax=Streptomyces luteogriseus TaxID=68233 RepID=UPI00278285C9|nr:hypothetical protein [Streptomyces luteogriseus]MDQ0710585.1 hypothetical protein [Streptomyces luteogriseus]
MRADIVWWDLSASGQTIETMRNYLRDESITAFSEVPGLRLKMWLSDPATNRWGAVLLWESEEASRQALPSRALELIGYPPAVAHNFDVEATTEGRFKTQRLSLQGLAFTETAERESSWKPTRKGGRT